MAWIESHQALGQHPKTLAFAAALNCSLPTAVGHLQYLWWWALDYAQDGLVTARTQPVAIRACQVQRQPDRFWTALVDAGFVDVIDQGYLWRIHDWRDYAGQLIDRRRKDAERKRESRRTSTGTTGPSPADGGRTSGARPHVPTNQPDQPTGPDRTQPTGPNPDNELNPSSTLLPARTRAPESPELLAEHLKRLDQERRQRQRQQPKSSETKDDADGG